jgi:tRNA A37 threonylcarbamoyladenosine dehydratase
MTSTFQPTPPYRSIGIDCEDLSGSLIACMQVADISDTHHDAFARVVRGRLRKRGIARGLPVIFSPEPPVPNSMAHTEQRYKRSYYGTMSYMYAVKDMPSFQCVKWNAVSGS